MRINPVFEPVLRDTSHRWLVLYGGAGSGKSVVAAQWVVLRCIQNVGERILVTRKVARTIRHSVWHELLVQIRECGFLEEFSVNLSNLTITNKRTGSEIVCVGLDDPEKIKSISGVTACWHEEPTECDEQDLIQVDLRLRGQHPAPKQHIVTFNPVSASHWIRAFFWQKNADTSLRIKTTYKHNGFLDVDYGKTVEALRDKDEYYYQVYCLGNWGELSGLIYTPWEFADFPDTFDDEFGCVDFGFNNPIAALHVRVKDQRLFVRELVYRSKMQISELCGLPEMKALRDSVMFYGDSEDPGAIEEMRLSGYAVRPADKGKNSVKNGILLLRSLSISSHANNVGLNKELQTYMWRKDHNGNVLDEPVKELDHALDAVRYGVWTRMRKLSWVEPGFRKNGGVSDD